LRKVFTQTLIELAQQDDRILLLTGDLGFMALEPFADKFPDRFFNVGVAEQNMVGLATGLAEAGFIPFVYSIVTFATLRPYEFFRNGPVLHHLPVRLIGIGGGFEYGSAGPTHHGLEDVGVMRLQPGLTVITPADPPQARTAFQETWDLPGPIYYRLSKDDTLLVPELAGRFELGKADLIAGGPDLLFITMGNITAEVMAAARLLAEQGIRSSVLAVSTVSPAPVRELVEALGRFSLAISVEAHYKTGGLGSLVAETIAENGLNCRLVRCGVGKSQEGLSGSQNYLYRVHGLDIQSLAETARQALAANSVPGETASTGTGINGEVRTF